MLLVKGSVMIVKEKRSLASPTGIDRWLSVACGDWLALFWFNVLLNRCEMDLARFRSLAVLSTRLPLRHQIQTSKGVSRKNNPQCDVSYIRTLFSGAKNPLQYDRIEDTRKLLQDFSAKRLSKKLRKNEQRKGLRNNQAEELLYRRSEKTSVLLQPCGITVTNRPSKTVKK